MAAAAAAAAVLRRQLVAPRSVGVAGAARAQLVGRRSVGVAGAARAALSGGVSRLEKQQKKRGYFYEMFEAGNNEGKLFKGSPAIVSRSNAMALPPIAAQGLTGGEANLPHALSGAPALVIISYRQYGLNHAKPWAELLDPEKSTSVPGLPVVKLSIVEHTLLRMMFQFLVKATLMRELPEWLHASTYVAFKDEPRWRDEADILNRCVCYLYLLDADGLIRWRCSGPPTDDEVNQLRKHTATLLEEAAAKGSKK